MDVVGVADRKKNQIIKSYRNSGWATLREEFAEWSRSAIQHGGPIMYPFQARVGGDNLATPITKEDIPALSAEVLEDGF
jgi:hypothetical protein